MSGARVLLVDKDEDTRAILAGALSHLGFAVEHATDFRAAWDLLATTQPDAIVTEIERRITEAGNFIRQLRADRDHSAIRVVVFTARNSPEFVERARRAGADAFVTKPEPPFALAELIQRVLRGEKIE